MVHLIDKDALVAEIERRKQDAINNCGGFKSMREHECDSCIVGQYEEMKEILDTLEVKWVDLEKEINKYICDNFFGSETIGFYANRTKEEPNDQDIALCAKHFFELGLKAQKGE